MAKNKKKVAPRTTIFHYNNFKIIDPKTKPEPILDSWTGYIIPDHRGEPVIPVSIVGKVLAENEEMREALYDDVLDLPVRIYHQLNAATGVTTKSVKQQVGDVCNNTGGVIKPKDVFDFLFGVILTRDDIKECEPNESLLHLTWRLGYLPLLVVHLSCFKQMINICRWGGALPEFEKVLKIIRRGQKKLSP